MSDRRRIGVIKPDFGAVGGFERHLDALLSHIQRRCDAAGLAWEFEIVPVPVERPPHIFGLPISDSVRHRHDDFFLWAATVEAVQRLDLGRFDAILTTQPPSYLAPHPHKVALFYHHARQFYDQAELFAESGFIDARIHAAAIDAVRTVEADVPAGVTHWLAGSHNVARRLETFWSIPPTAISIHRAPSTTMPPQIQPYAPDGPVLCVGRFEWPKRQELAIAAAWHGQRHGASPWPLLLVGDGSRHAFGVELDRRFRIDPHYCPDDATLWRNPGRFATEDPAPLDALLDEAVSPVEFAGALSDTQRDAAYARSSVVLVPTAAEDYGLTVLEAMAHGRPVVVCDDGGGLIEFIDDGVNGRIVEPTPAAIDQAITQLRADPAQAAAMGSAGRRYCLSITWDDAANDVIEAFDHIFTDHDADA